MKWSMEGYSGGFTVIEYNYPTCPGSFHTDIAEVAKKYGEHVVKYNKGNPIVKDDVVTTDNATRVNAMVGNIVQERDEDKPKTKKVLLKLPKNATSGLQLVGASSDWQGDKWSEVARQGEAQLNITGALCYKIGVKDLFGRNVAVPNFYKMWEVPMIGDNIPTGKTPMKEEDNETEKEFLKEFDTVLGGLGGS